MAGAKLFTKQLLNSKGDITKIRVSRDMLIADDVAEELNSYRMWDRFTAFNDYYAPKYDSATGKEIPGDGPASPAVKSIFNKSGAVMTGIEPNEMDASDYRIGLNVPLMDTPTNRRRIRENSDCSVRALVRASQEGMLGHAVYNYADFMYCKYLGRLPNSYLITLRRFPIPVDDYIGTMGVAPTTRLNKAIRAQNSASIGCLVSWIGTPGNEMANILKYTFSMPFKTENAQWQETADADSQGGFANSIAAMFDPEYRKAYQLGHGGAAFESYIGGLFGNSGKGGPYDAKQFLHFQDKNKVYGPVDAVKSTYMRSDEGLQFNQDITLTFDYELRSYNGINGRQAMLDLLANILAVTYSSGTFWGGGFRGGGMHQNNIFANLEIYRTKGGFTNFMDAFAKDVSTVTKSFRDTMEKEYGGSWLAMLKSALNQLGGMILGGALNKLGRPARVMANSLLSPAPVGFWHVSIGNPWHPIVSMGNMILKETSIEHYGPLGLDDFPTGLKVTCTLTRGKPRDSRGIEQMYMLGNDRIYTSMGPEVLTMYKYAKDYKGTRDRSKSGNVDSQPNTSPTEGNADKTGDTMRQEMDAYKKFSGGADQGQIVVAAEEQEYGSQPGKSEQKQANG